MGSLAAIAVAGLAGVGNADSNQELADVVARQIRSSGKVHGYSLDIQTNLGVVTVTGSVASNHDREAVVDLVRAQQGVLAVRDRISVQDAATRPVADFEEPMPMPPSNVTEGPEQQVIEPEPVMDYAGGIAPYSDAPVMPPYAWPAYTPYNNFASVAYQTQYPSGAWPFIGPPYPYPMIPSGWRRVTLTWKKGYWWMRFNAH
jgi:hypothetical protein